MSDNPGFDFITLTKGQWAHLKIIEREHGIPWYIYIRDLIKADMEGRLLHPSPRERRKKLKPSYEARSVENLIAKVEALLNRPQQVMISAPPPPGSGAFTQVFEQEEQVKVSELDEVEVDPNVLKDGTRVASPEFRNAFMDELREKLGLEPLERKKKASIQFPDHVITSP